MHGYIITAHFSDAKLGKKTLSYIQVNKTQCHDSNFEQ